MQPTVKAASALQALQALQAPATFGTLKPRHQTFPINFQHQRLANELIRAVRIIRG